MPNVIISPAFAIERARERQRKYEIIGQGVQNVGNTIAQSMLDYQTQAKQEENLKLRLVDHMVQVYGADADQPLLESYDKLLAPHGLSLPKDSSGRRLPPPPQTEFQQLREQLTKGDPSGEKMANWVERKATGKSLIQERLEQENHDETVRWHDLEHDAAIYRGDIALATARLRNNGKGSEPSGWIRMGNGELLQDQGQDVPAGAKRLTAGEFDRDHKKRMQDSLDGLRDVNRKKSVIDIKIKQHRLALDLMYGEFKEALPLLDRKAKGILDPSMDPFLDKRLRKALEKNGIHEKKEQDSWIAQIMQGWLGMPKEAQEDALSGVTIDPDVMMKESEGGPSATLTPPSKPGSVLVPGAEDLGWEP